MNQIVFFSLTLIVLSAAMPAAGYCGTVPPDSSICPGLEGQALADSLVLKYKAGANLGYNSGRDTIYGEIDIVGDSLRCVYTGKWIHGGPTTAPRTWINNNNFNCEHTWPQSLLPSLAQSDMQHLFATEMNTNNARGNYPFAELADSTQVSAWYRYDHYDPPLYSFPPDRWEEYSKLGYAQRFEPRTDHQGVVARAMYYVYTMYKSMYPDTNTWWQGQRDMLSAWHAGNPADAREIARTRKVAMHQQGKINPFVFDSTLVRRCYYPGTGVESAFSDATVSVVAVRPNRPNPFSGRTEIRYALARPSDVELDIYDIAGRRIRAVSGLPGSTGEHAYRLSLAPSTPRGVYFCRLTAGGRPIAVLRMVLVR